MPWGVLPLGGSWMESGSSSRARVAMLEKGGSWQRHPTWEIRRPSLTPLQVTWCPGVLSPLGPGPLIGYTLDKCFTGPIINGP